MKNQRLLWAIVLLTLALSSFSLFLRYWNAERDRAMAYSCGYNDAAAQKLPASAGRLICDGDRKAAQHLGFVVVQGGRGI